MQNETQSIFLHAGMEPDNPRIVVPRGMHPSLKSASEYRQQAQALRLKASTAVAAETREVLNQLAHDYELLAKSVAALAKSRQSLSDKNSSGTGKPTEAFQRRHC